MKIDEQCINTVRTLAMDAVQKAKSGHPGAPMGMAAAASALWVEILRHNPENPLWQNRDRFILSAGHASMLLYSLLFLTGYDLSLEDLKNFRQMESKTPGHPEFGITPGVETTTGPLGQGFSNAVGMALAEKHMAAVYNRPGFNVVDHYTYVMAGDGDLMEGITSEAASFAGHNGLGKLICLYDDNEITIEGGTDIAFTEDVAMRFRAYNWHVTEVEDGNDVNAVLEAVNGAKDEKEKPSLIILKTHIAFGSPNKQGTSDAHGAPLGEDEILLTKKKLGWPWTESFYVPEDVLEVFRSCRDKGREQETQWKEMFSAYSEKHSSLAEEWLIATEKRLPEGWDKDLPVFSSADKPMATRSASGKVINAIAGNIPGLLGGSADLAPSNNTLIASSHDFQKNTPDGRNIRFGVREHAMGGILNGISLHGGLVPYGATFLVFSDYMRAAIRLSALMKQPVIYIFTHDSIAVGEDGPTHQPVEHLAALRAIPGLVVIRPGDAAETVEAWRQALEITDAPVALILSRQNLPVIDRSRYSPATGLSKGAYVLSGLKEKPDLIIIATGSEVHIALSAAEKLAENNIKARVVSMPSIEFYEMQSVEYRNSVLPPDIDRRIVVEAGISMGWEKYAGEKGLLIGMNSFGASAPGNEVMKHFGFTTDNIVSKAMELMKG